MRFPLHSPRFTSVLLGGLLLGGALGASTGSVPNAPVICPFSSDTAENPGCASWADEHGATFRLRAYRIDQLWGGKHGYPSATPYRAKITLWATYAAGDTGDQAQAVAELFFYDEALAASIGPNPDVKQPNNPSDARYHLRFPVSTLAGIIHQLSGAGQPVYLIYYHPAQEKESAIVTKQDQPVIMKPEVQFQMRPA